MCHPIAAEAHAAKLCRNTTVANHSDCSGLLNFRIKGGRILIKWPFKRISLEPSALDLVQIGAGQAIIAVINDINCYVPLEC